MQPGIIIIEPTPYTRALAYMYGTHTGIHYHTHTHTDKSLKCTEGEEKSKLEARRRICSGNKNQKCNDAWLVYINFLLTLCTTHSIYIVLYMYMDVFQHMCVLLCVCILYCAPEEFIIDFAQEPGLGIAGFLAKINSLFG